MSQRAYRNMVPQMSLMIYRDDCLSNGRENNKHIFRWATLVLMCCRGDDMGLPHTNFCSVGGSCFMRAPSPLANYQILYTRENQ
jgi:hypothetical protein